MLASSICDCIVVFNHRQLQGGGNPLYKITHLFHLTATELSITCSREVVMSLNIPRAGRSQACAGMPNPREFGFHKAVLSQQTPS